MSTFDLFLSHASEDKAAVRAFAGRIRRAGLDPWLDEEQMPAGAEPRDAIVAGLEASQHVAIWVTAHWCKKDWTRWELGLFSKSRSTTRRVIPILHLPWDDKTFGPYLTRGIAIDPDLNDDERLWRVVSAVREEPPGPREDWAARGRALDGAAPRPVKARRVPVGMVGVEPELGGALDKLASMLRARPQVGDLVRVEPHAADAFARLAPCELCIVLTGMSVGGQVGFSTIEALLAEPRTLSARRFPVPDADQDRFGDDFAFSRKLIRQIERTFSADGAADALRAEISRKLKALVPVEPGTSSTLTPWEANALQRWLPQWLVGLHPALVNRAHKIPLQRAALYVSMNADPSVVHRREDGEVVLVDTRPTELAEELGRGRSEPSITPVSIDRALGLRDSFRRCLVVGEAGTGKTVLVQHLAAALALHHLEGSIPGEWAACAAAVRAASELDPAALSADGPVPIPVLIEARELDAADRADRDGALERLIAKRLGAPSAEALQAGLAAGRYWLLVDSLDEVATTDRRQRVLQILAGVFPHHGRLLVTSRPGAHTAAHVPAVLRTLPIGPLDDALRGKLATRWADAQGYGDPDRTRLTEAIRDLQTRFDAQTGDRPIEDNPLLLTCTFLVFQEHQRLPDNTADLYRRMLEILCESKVGTRADGDDPDQERRHSVQNRLQRALALGWALQVRGVTVASRRQLAEALLADRSLGLADLDAAEAMIGTLAATTAIFREEEADGVVVVRPWHRSFQEYLAARQLALAERASAEALVDGLVASRRLLDPTWTGCLRFLIGAVGQLTAQYAQEVVVAMRDRARSDEPAVAGRLYALAATGAAEYRPESFDGQDALLAEVGRAALDRFAADGARFGWLDRVALLDALARLGLDDRFPDPREDPGGWVRLDAWEGDIGGDAKALQGLPGARVRVGPLWVLNRPVTVGDYAPFVAAGHAEPPDWARQTRTSSRPVWGVDWNDAVAFCRWATGAWALANEGDIVDLPTSTEWESIARREGGGAFPWGDADPGGGDGARASHNWGEQTFRSATPVGAFPSGTLLRGGAPVHDWVGNVWGWTRTLWGENGAEQDVDLSTIGVEDATLRGAPRVLRGGSWGSPARSLRCSTRGRRPPGYRLGVVGFRVVLRPGSSR